MTVAGTVSWPTLTAVVADPALFQSWLAAVLVNVTLATLAWRQRVLDVAGAVAAAGVGFVVAVGAGASAWLTLALFFVLAVGATSWRHRREGAASRPERRSARNVLANGAVAAGAAAAAGLGAPVALCAVAVAAALAEAAADTAGGEIGQGLAGPTVRVSDGRRVEPGTDGGVSAAGSLAGAAAALAVAAMAGATGLVTSESVLPVAACGVAGSGLDSLLGATLERRGLLDNEGVNLAATLAAALLAVVWIAR